MSFQRPDSPGDHGSSVLRTSASLIDGMREDDGAAWDRMVALYAPLVARWCRGQKLSEADAADVFQEVFQAVAAHIGRFHQGRRGDTFRGWLRTITRNKIHDLHRRRRREPQGVGGSEARRRMNQFPVTPASDDSAGGSSVPGFSDQAGSASSVQGSNPGSCRHGLSKQSVPSAADAATVDPAISDPAAERTLFHRGLELIRREFEPRTWQAFWRTAVDGRAAADVAAELGMSAGAVRVAKSRVLGRLRSELGDVAGTPRRSEEHS